MRTSRSALTLILGFAMLGAACNSGPDRDASGAVKEEGELQADKIKTGDCFDEPSGTSIESVVAIPCDQPHDNEAFLVYELDEFAVVGLQEKIDEKCLPAFQEYVGIDFDSSVLEMTYLTPPDLISFNEGLKTVICYAGSPEGKVTGTIKGSNK